MTEKLFYKDSHMSTFSAVVKSCEKTKKGYEAVLDRTAFFPEGGGQSADTGWINGIEVTDARERDGEVYHLMKEPLIPGEEVEGKIRDKERFSKMQQHTGEHIISGLVHKMYGYNNVGFHLGTEDVTMDFDGVLNKEQMREIEYLANEAVAKNLDVVVTYPSKDELKDLEYRSKIEIEGQVRIVTIPGYDVCACCAPHMDTTGQIGLIKLTGLQNYKGGVRISMLCGFRALADYNVKEDNTRAIGAELSAKEEKLVEAVVRQKEEAASLKLENASLWRQILHYKAQAMPDNEPHIWHFDSELSGDTAREFANILMDKNTGICGIFFGSDRSGYRYVIASKTTDIRPIAKQLNADCNGKGGGKPEMVQGSLNATREQIQECLECI